MSEEYELIIVSTLMELNELPTDDLYVRVLVLDITEGAADKVLGLYEPKADEVWDKINGITQEALIQIAENEPSSIRSDAIAILKEQGTVEEVPEESLETKVEESPTVAADPIPSALQDALDDDTVETVTMSSEDIGNLDAIMFGAPADELAAVNLADMPEDVQAEINAATAAVMPVQPLIDETPPAVATMEDRVDEYLTTYETEMDPIKPQTKDNVIMYQKKLINVLAMVMRVETQAEFNKLWSLILTRMHEGRDGVYGMNYIARHLVDPATGKINTGKAWAEKLIVLMFQSADPSKRKDIQNNVDLTKVVEGMQIEQAEKIINYYS